MFEFANEVKGACFEAKSMKGPEFVQMLLSVWGGNQSQDLTRLFCSELAAACYQKCGLIPDDNATNYQPQHFAEGKMGVLQGGASLGPETWLRLDQLVNMIRVTIVSASDLKDVSWLGPMFASCFNAGDIPDAYCICKLKKRERFRTDYIQDSKDPEWNFVQDIDWDGTDKLNFEVWDTSTSGFNDDEYIGTATLDSDSFEEGFYGTLPLIDDDGFTSGQLEVSVEILRQARDGELAAGR
jgi:hypothetical protein